MDRSGFIGMKRLICVTLVLLATSAPAQDQDSLKASITRHPDSIALYLAVAKQYLFNTPDSARSYLGQALARAREQGHVLKEAETLKLLGIWQDIQSVYDSALVYYRLAGELFEREGDRRGYADVLNNMAYTRTRQGSYKEALEYYYQAVDIYREEGQHVLEARSYSNIGIVFQRTNDLDKALEMYREALKKARGDDPRTQYLAATNIATIHMRRGDFPVAIATFDTLIQVYEKKNDLRALSLMHNNLAYCYHGLGEYARSRQHYASSIAYKKQINDEPGLANAYKNYAEVDVLTGNYMRARAYLDSSMVVAQELGDLEAHTAAMSIAADLENKSGRYREAATVFEQYVLLRDSLDAAEQAEMIQELSQKYESEQKERRIVELELDKKTADLALATSENQRNIFISAAVILLTLAGFIGYRYQVNRRTSRLLEQKNAQISTALEERELLLKEIHHRVKNNLQVISSLLNLQAGSLIDEAAIDAVKEGQNRVKSMALIHQKLYSAEDIRGVDVQDYLENLSAELFSAFGVDQEKVKYRIDTSGLKLDIDTVIPLGLIINELITNTIKYAFEKSHDGLLEIQMKEEAGKLTVLVKDNGKGLDEKALESSNSFGWKMIRSLSRKLKAEISILNDQGTQVQLTLSRYKLVV